MSKVCEICGKAPVAGRNVSHSHRVTNRTFRPNVQKVTVKIDGKVKRAKAYKRHILTKKDTKRTRRLRAGGYADTTNVDAIRKMIPYK